MTETNQSLSEDYFNRIYAADSDPWGFATREYEQNKYQDTLAHLPRARYRRTLEIGCSIGVLSAQLAARTDALLAIDISETPLVAARERCALQPHARFRQLAFPHAVPDGPFDLLVVSEVAYYWGGDDLHLAQQRIQELLEPGGDLILVHWLPYVTDYPYTGDEVHDSFAAFAQTQHWTHLGSKREQLYRMDVYRKGEVG